LHRKLAGLPGKAQKGAEWQGVQGGDTLATCWGGGVRIYKVTKSTDRSLHNAHRGSAGGSEGKVNLRGAFEGEVFSGGGEVKIVGTKK